LSEIFHGLEGVDGDQNGADIGENPVGVETLLQILHNGLVFDLGQERHVVHSGTNMIRTLPVVNLEMVK